MTLTDKLSFSPARVFFSHTFAILTPRRPGSGYFLPHDAGYKHEGALVAQRDLDVYICICVFSVIYLSSLWE